MKTCFSLLFALVFGGVARACSCAPPPAPKIALQNADAVFVGQVLSVRATGQYERLFVFNISKAWKGKAAGKVAVESLSEGSLCGVNFQVGQKYLVYASRGGKNLRASLCSRTRHLKGAAQDIAELSDPRPLAPPPAPAFVVHSTLAAGAMARPLQDLLGALEQTKAKRIRVFWRIGGPRATDPPNGERGGVTALYDRQNATFKFYASFLRADPAPRRHLVGRSYRGVTPAVLAQLAAKYRDDKSVTNYSFFDRLPEFGAIVTGETSVVKAP